MSVKDATNGSWEKLAAELCQHVSAEFMQTQLRVCSGGKPHPVGSVANCELAETIAADWKRWGIPVVNLQEFFVTIPLGPHPEGPWNEVVLTNFDQTAVLHRAQNYVSVPTNASITSGDDEPEKEPPVRLPVYQAYSCNGSTVGPLVFVNYARPSDLIAFDVAQQRKPDEPSLLCCPNVIAIARLQSGGRQAKVRSLLQHCTCGPDDSPLPGHHPAALLLYPDPQDTLAPGRPVYPNGPGLPGDAPVFGHTCMSHVGGGNPNAPHLPSSDHIYEEDALVPGHALTTIPVQPIGYDDATIFLAHLSGHPIPVAWQGCLASKLGPTTDSLINVIVNNRVSAERVRCLNVIGVLPGSSDEADQYIVFGNHRDAWVLGACDPGSGTVILQQLANLLGMAYKQGFRPRRTIVLANWDGEELSLLGSTHTCEAMSMELQQRAVAYINADCPVKGRLAFSARTDRLLIDALLKASQLVETDPPVQSTSWLEDWLASEGKSPDQEPSFTEPGVGSDHIPFAYKLGIPSFYPEFLPDDGLYYLPVYHTAYDNVHVVEQFTDPASEGSGPLPRHRLLARLTLTYILQLACAVRIPYSLSRWTETLVRQWKLFEKHAISKLPNLISLGINLCWVSSDLSALKAATLKFSALLDEHEKNPESFPSLYNRILTGLPKQFIKQSNRDASSFPHVLYHPVGYKHIYFPHVKSAFKEVVRQSQLHPTCEPMAPLRLLKNELSILTACIQQATSWLSNGLAGLPIYETERE